MSATYFPNAYLWNVDPGPNCPDVVRVVVEIGKNSTNKYEYDATLGVFRLDRALYSPMHLPGDYGFVPGTIAEDGEPIDVLVLVDQPSFPGCIYDVRPVGVLDMMEGQTADHKLLAVPIRSPRLGQLTELTDVFPHVRREIEHFFAMYKELEGGETSMLGWRGANDARGELARSRQRYLDDHAAEDRASAPG